MIRTLIMVECDSCDCAFGQVVSLLNSSEIDRAKLRSLLLKVEQAGWQSERASTVHICEGCKFGIEDDQKEPEDEFVSF